MVLSLSTSTLFFCIVWRSNRDTNKSPADVTVAMKEMGTNTHTHTHTHTHTLSLLKRIKAVPKSRRCIPDVLVTVWVSWYLFLFKTKVSHPGVDRGTTDASILEEEVDVQECTHYISWTVRIKCFRQPTGNHKRRLREECVCDEREEHVSEAWLHAFWPLGLVLISLTHSTSVSFRIERN